MAKAPTFAGTKRGYYNMWKSMKVTRVTQCDTAARRILASKARYQAVEDKTGVPWFFIAILHMRESNNNFAGVLHNGEKIIGTGRKTKLVPAGRGPFSSWEQAAIDAIQLKGLQKIDWTQDTISRIGYHGEEYNGWGYTWRKVNSPYMWAGSNHYTKGKYVADGKFSATHVDQQLGIMPVLQRLSLLDSSVAARLTDTPSPVVRNSAAGGAVAVGLAGAAGAFYGDFDWPTIIAILAIAAAASVVLWHVLSKRD